MLSRISFALALAWTGSAWGQTVISAHSGVIQYVEGQVTLDGKTVEPKFAEFPDIKAGQTLAAADGRAEILLTPGVFLRIAENSSFRMVSNKLSDTRIDVLSGSALVEVGELLKDNAIALQVHDTEMALLQKGLYRVDAGDPALNTGGRLRVYKGEARLTSGSNTITAKGGREVQLGAVLEAKSFSSNDTDAFYRWSARRDEYVAEANLSAAKSASSGGGMGFGSSGTGAGAGMWGWNQWYGMFTYVPYDGMYTSPFGYAFYSPLTVGAFYAPYYYGGYSGYSGRPIAGSNPYNGARPLSSPARSGMPMGGGGASTGGVARSSAGSGGGAISAGGAGARAGGGSRGR